MAVWKMTSNGEIDSFQLNQYVRHLVVNVYSVIPTHTVTRHNKSKYEKFGFIVDNGGPELEGSKAIIYCHVQEDAVNKFVPLIKPNMIIRIEDARVIERKNAPGTTPFSLQIFNNTIITPMDDSDNIDEVNANAMVHRPGPSRERDIELGTPLESSRKLKKRAFDFFEELNEGFAKIDANKRRRLELDILYRVQIALLDQKYRDVK